MGHLQRSAKKTFWQRLGSVALFWGLPSLLLELVGLPRHGLGVVLLIEAPAAAAGVLVFTLIEMGIVRILRPLVDEPHSKPPSSAEPG